MSDSRITGFKDASPSERARILAARAGLGMEQAKLLATPGALSLERANGMIENVVGTFELPLAVATNFTINGRDYLVPMALEEPSVVAGASFMARIARSCGGFSAGSSTPLMRGQIQVVGVADVERARRSVLARRDQIVAAANACDPTLASLGGGCRDVEAHAFRETPRGAMVVVHLLVDVRDAMGANAVNTMAEAVAPLVEAAAGGTVRLRILSNLADRRLAWARIELPPESLATAEFDGPRVIDGILDAYALAAVDPYRAATHNKGIMNGIDPIIIATGNDWRAVEAGAHAYAAREGRYAPLSSWETNAAGHLVGHIELPLAVGLVGGATRTHPLAQVALAILGVTAAQELAQVIAAVGLAQNLAALRALSTEGIQRGHMELHARNLASAAGASGPEIDAVVARMLAGRAIRADAAAAALAAIRNEG